MFSATLLKTQTVSFQKWMNFLHSSFKHNAKRKFRDHHAAIKGQVSSEKLPVYQMSQGFGIDA